MVKLQPQSKQISTNGEKNLESFKTGFQEKWTVLLKLRKVSPEN